LGEFLARISQLVNCWIQLIAYELNYTESYFK